MCAENNAETEIQWECKDLCRGERLGSIDRWSDSAIEL
jgi:hypothetical protein